MCNGGTTRVQKLSCGMSYDQHLIGLNKRGRQQLIDNISRVTKEYGIKINVKKLNITCISRQTKGWELREEIAQVLTVMQHYWSGHRIYLE